MGSYLVDDVLVHVQIVVLLVDKVEVVVVLVVVIVVEVVCNICHCAGDKTHIQCSHQIMFGICVDFVRWTYAKLIVTV